MGQHPMPRKRPPALLWKDQNQMGVLGGTARSTENTSLDAGTDPAAGHGRSFLGTMISLGKERHSDFPQSKTSIRITLSLCHWGEMFPSASQCLMIYTWFCSHCLSLWNENTGQTDRKGVPGVHWRESQDDPCSTDLARTGLQGRTKRFLGGAAKKNSQDWETVWSADRCERIKTLLEMTAVNWW